MTKTIFIPLGHRKIIYGHTLRESCDAVITVTGLYADHFIDRGTIAVSNVLLGNVNDFVCF